MRKALRLPLLTACVLSFFSAVKMLACKGIFTNVEYEKLVFHTSDSYSVFGSSLHPHERYALISYLPLQRIICALHRKNEKEFGSLKKNFMARTAPAQEAVSGHADTFHSYGVGSFLNPGEPRDYCYSRCCCCSRFHCCSHSLRY